MKKGKAIAVKNSLRELESSYVNNQIANLDTLVKERENELTNKLVKYKEECVVKLKDKNGLDYTTTNLNPILIKGYFFKSINPMANKEPVYSAEKLGVVWELFNEMVIRINQEIGDFTPNITTFCEFAGITVPTFNRYKTSADEDMRVVTQKISDSCYNANVTLAQKGRLRERSTLYRMKSEQKVLENEQPQIHFHAGDEINLGQMMERLNELSKFNRKKDEIEVSGKEV